jgi:hypothetical protein
MAARVTHFRDALSCTVAHEGEIVIVLIAASWRCARSHATTPGSDAGRVVSDQTLMSTRITRTKLARGLALPCSGPGSDAWRRRCHLVQPPGHEIVLSRDGLLQDDTSLSLD